MTTTRIVPIAAIQSVRLSCRHCGFGLLIPLNTKAVPHQCPACASKVHAHEVLDVARGLRWLKEVEPSAEFGFDAALEVVESRQG